jgi:hypothetical protein
MRTKILNQKAGQQKLSLTHIPDGFLLPFRESLATKQLLKSGLELRVLGIGGKLFMRINVVFNIKHKLIEHVLIISRNNQ